jgi:hypothetical protein
VSASGDISAAIIAWAVEVLPELDGAGYDYATDERYKGLPDVACEISSWALNDFPGADRRLAQLQQVQQLRMKTYEVEVIIAVPPDPADQAEAALKDLTDRLTDDYIRGVNMRGKVAQTSGTVRVSFRPPFVEFDDGTRARIATVYLQVGQQVDA